MGVRGDIGCGGRGTAGTGLGDSATAIAAGIGGGGTGVMTGSGSCSLAWSAGCSVAATGGESVTDVTDACEGWTAEVDGGTSVMCGRAGSGGGAGCSPTAGLRPCSSSFLSSNEATRLRMRLTVCLASEGEETDSLCWR